MRGMASERNGLSTLHAWRAINVDETPVIASYDDFTISTLLNPIHMGSVGGRRENPLYVPSEFAGGVGPFGVSELCCAIGYLFQLLNIPE